MDTLHDLGEKLPKDASWWDSFWSGKASFDDLKDIFQDLVDAAGVLVTGAATIGDVSEADKLVDMLLKLMALSDLSEMLENFGDFSWQKFTAGLSQITGGFDLGPHAGEKELNDAIDNVNSFAKMVNDTILEAAPDINAVPLIQAIADGMQGEESKSILRKAFSVLGTLLAGEGITIPQTGVSDGGMSGGLSLLFGDFDGSSLTAKINSALSQFNPEELSNKLGVSDIFDTGDMKSEVEAMMASMQQALDSGEYSLDVSMVPNWSDGNVSDWWNGTSPMPISGTIAIDAASLVTINTNLESIQAAINAKGDAVVLAIGNLESNFNSLEEKLSSVSDAISNMRVVLDTGVIAGAVDKELGKRASVEERTTIP